MAIKTDGTLWAWGEGSDGQLGFGNTSNTSSPAQVGALTTWSQVKGGRKSTYAIKTDGTLWAWGAGSDGALGHNNTTNLSSPVSGRIINYLGQNRKLEFSHWRTGSYYSLI